MHVLIVRGIPGESRSADICSGRLATALRRLCPDWRVELVSPPGFLSTSSLLSKVVRYVYRYFVYPLVLLRRNADVYHIADHSYGHLVPVLRRKRPTLVTCHDLINLRYPERLTEEAQFPRLSAATWAYSVRSMQSATHVISVSNHTKQEVRRLLNISQERITVVPNGIDEAFRPLPPEDITAFRRRHGVDTEALCLLHVGSVVGRKNIRSILGAVRALVNQGVPVRFWKVGANFNAEQEAYIRRHRLREAVRYLGALPLSDLVRAYNAADTFVFPSTNEGFGMPVIEAMACGTPVVTSDVSALPETAGDAAMTVNPIDVEAIVGAILTLWQDPTCRQEMVTRGLARANAYTWERASRQVAGVYERVVEKSSRFSNVRKQQF